MLLVGERVVHAVLLRPPLDAVSVHERGHVPQRIAQRAAPVNVVVTQPTCLHHAQPEQNRRHAGVAVGEVLARHVQAEDTDQRPRLLEDVALKEAVLLKLAAEIAEGHGGRVFARGGLLELLGRGGVALWQLGQAVHRLGAPVGAVGVQRVEHIGGVAAVKEVDPAFAARVRQGPAASVVPLRVDLDAYGFPAGFFVDGHSGLCRPRVGVVLNRLGAGF
mmetsp:Transcript_24450/g.39335  ORF Transcript_24450/g.39335 Transcript_24450/m.39335 type:complete len:219 (-) Transcript_24450:401-1057(-)